MFIPGANDEWRHLSEAERVIVLEMLRHQSRLLIAVEKLIDTKEASLDLAAVLEDAGNRLIGLSENISASRPRRSRL